MKLLSKHIEKGNPFIELISLLDGKVFHVTTEKNWSQIETTQKILPNSKDAQRTFGSNSYFQHRNCVCLFDYRSFYEKKQQEHYHDCLPTSPLTEEEPIRILFLNPIYYDRLISWKEWEKDGIGKTNVLPYLESGFEGSIPLSYIKETLKVTITEDKNSFAYRMKKAQSRIQNA